MTKLRDKILDLHDILSCKTLLRDTLCDKTEHHFNTPACLIMRNLLLRLPQSPKDFAE